jgi:hypothetical protein
MGSTLKNYGNNANKNGVVKMIGRIKNGYFIAPDSGLAFKINILTMGSLGNDLKKINDEVDRKNGLIKSDADNCLVTLGFHASVWNSAMITSKAMADIIASKTRPFVYLPKEVANPEEIALPGGFFEKAFVWNASDEKVWTPFDSNALGYRYHSISADLIPEVVPTDPATPPDGNNPLPTVTSNAEIRLACLDIAFDIAVHNAQGILQAEPITQLADKLVAWANK